MCLRGYRTFCFVPNFLSGGCGYRDVDYSGRTELHESSVAGDIAFVRDITYWLCLSGRTNEMISGLLCSEDILYFVIVISMFLLLSILKLQSTRQRVSFSMVWGKYLGVVVIAMLLGFVTSRPVMMCYYDATETKRNTLTPNSQEVMSKLEGGMTITTYVNFWIGIIISGCPIW